MTCWIEIIQFRVNFNQMKPIFYVFCTLLPIIFNFAFSEISNSKLDFKCDPPVYLIFRNESGLFLNETLFEYFLKNFNDLSFATLYGRGKM